MVSQTQSRPRPSDSKDMIPKPLLLAMLALVLATLAVVSFAVLTGRAHVGVPQSAAIVAERSIILKGGGAQAVQVLSTDGKLLMDLPHGGFITVIQNGMERARLTAGVDKLKPLRIVEYANGRLAAQDDYTGWSAELGAFGSDNRAAFERLMSQL
ncbi:photosynthetic complex assembly protein PuhC [Cypionkella sinensis]|uniref:Photosynthetic complex assembly protein PuhC n=1 Tax=Cypionkella sinensis TaxID=1756043 RepID=A0ABV7IY28_9RHOB